LESQDTDSDPVDLASSLPSSRSDVELIAASLDHPEAFGEIFERHYECLRRFCERRLGRDVGQDVAAETFVVAFGSRDRFDRDRGDVVPWLFGIATNLTRRHRRREAAQMRAYARALDGSDRSESDIDEVVAAMDGARRAARALAHLRRPERDVVLLYAWGELSYEQISDALEIPVGTVRSRLSRARARMRELDTASAARTG
jgi:RNA polymerase sigma-70 factor (ECF subfamily)